MTTYHCAACGITMIGPIVHHSCPKEPRVPSELENADMSSLARALDHLTMDVMRSSGDTIREDRDRLTDENVKLARENADLRAKLDDIVRGKCVVKDCTNRPDQGHFVGTLCAPCAATDYKATERRLSTAEAVCRLAVRIKEASFDDPGDAVRWTEVIRAWEGLA